MESENIMQDTDAEAVKTETENTATLAEPTSPQSDLADASPAAGKNTKKGDKLAKIAVAVCATNEALSDLKKCGYVINSLVDDAIPGAYVIIISGNGLPPIDILRATIDNQPAEGFVKL